MPNNKKLSPEKLLKVNWRDPTVVSLLAANITTIAMALIFNWSVLAIMWVYWAQSVIIGFFQFLKILTLQNFSVDGLIINGKRAVATEGTKIFTAIFFAAHYGIFHLGYAVFLFSFTSLGFILNFITPTGLGRTAAINAGTQEITFIIIGIAVFFINHLFSFIYYVKKPRPARNIGELMFFPYLRIIPMHLTIIFGSLFIGIGILTHFVTILFLLLKTGVDLAMHNIEHSEQQRENGI